MYAEQHLAETGQPGQCFQGLGRQRGNTKNDHPGRQAGRRGVEPGDGLNETLVNPGAALRHALRSDVEQ
ncbi:hypothetical protein D3C81_1356880 [compost metagenome]